MWWVCGRGKRERSGNQHGKRRGKREGRTNPHLPLAPLPFLPALLAVVRNVGMGTAHPAPSFFSKEVLSRTGNSSFQLQKHLSIFSLISQLCLARTAALEGWNSQTQSCSSAVSLLLWAQLQVLSGVTSPFPAKEDSWPLPGTPTVGKLQIQSIFHLWQWGWGIMKSEWKLWFWGFWLKHMEREWTFQVQSHFKWEQILFMLKENEDGEGSRADFPFLSSSGDVG